MNQYNALAKSLLLVLMLWTYSHSTSYALDCPDTAWQAKIEKNGGKIMLDYSSASPYEVGYQGSSYSTGIPKQASRAYTNTTKKPIDLSWLLLLNNCLPSPWPIAAEKEKL